MYERMKAHYMNSKRMRKAKTLLKNSTNDVSDEEKFKQMLQEIDIVVVEYQRVILRLIRKSPENWT